MGVRPEHCDCTTTEVTLNNFFSKNLPSVKTYISENLPSAKNFFSENLESALLRKNFFRLGICSVPKTNPLNNHFMREEEKDLIGELNFFINLFVTFVNFCFCRYILVWTCFTRVFTFMIAVGNIIQISTIL